VFSAGKLRVEMAAHEHRRQVIVRAGPPREDVAHAVHVHGAAGFRAPGDEEIAHLLVGIAQRDPPEPACLAGPDLARAHDGGPETGGMEAGPVFAYGHARPPRTRPGLPAPRERL